MRDEAAPPAHPEHPAYLDYAATTPVDPRVAACMAGCLTPSGSFGNPGSGTHAYGDAARDLVEAARAQVAHAVGAEPADIVWTSGATEANNLALFGVAEYYRDAGRHIVTVRTEHKAVLDPCRELERRGWQVTYLVPDRGGVLDPTVLAAALRPDTVLVSVMHVNNEIGVVQDIAAIAEVCKRHGKVRLHVDAAQSVGKCPLDCGAWGVDLVSLSGHKAYGPKGVGALLVSRRRGVQLRARQFGGGQERNLRPGTLPTHQVVGMGAAFELASASRREEAEVIARLRDRLWEGLKSLEGVLRNGEPTFTVAHILNVSIEDVEGESLVAAVRPWVAVATGSACTSASDEPSYVLRALGRSERLAESSLRFSLGRFSSDADVTTAIAAVTRAVTRLRRIAGRGVGSSVTAEEPCSSAGGRAGDYNELTWRHFTGAAHAGALSGAAVHRGAAGSHAQGTWVQFDLVIAHHAAHPQLAAVRFLAFGCPHVIAIADWLAEVAPTRTGLSLPESLEALRERFAVPIEKLGRLLIIEDAWMAAVS